MALNIMSRGCNLQLLSKEPVSSFFLSFLFFFFVFSKDYSMITQARVLGER
jgi:hypothetical protein